MMPSEFFYENAGFSFDPQTETAEEGKRRCANELAEAERWASDAGLSFAWAVDPDVNSSDHSDEPDPYSLWECVARDMNGDTVASLGAIDFGRDGDPWDDPYRRVVEAELAVEARQHILNNESAAPSP